MNKLQRVLPHILVVLSGIFITFLVLDEYNPTMKFISNPVSLKLLWAFCILSLVNATMLIRSNRKKVVEQNQKID